MPNGQKRFQIIEDKPKRFQIIDDIEEEELQSVTPVTSAQPASIPFQPFPRTSELISDILATPGIRGAVSGFEQIKTPREPDLPGVARGFDIASGAFDITASIFEAIPELAKKVGFAPLVKVLENYLQGGGTIGREILTFIAKQVTDDPKIIESVGAFGERVGQLGVTLGTFKGIGVARAGARTPLQVRLKARPQTPAQIEAIRAERIKIREAKLEKAGLTRPPAPPPPAEVGAKLLERLKKAESIEEVTKIAGETFGAGLTPKETAPLLKLMRQKLPEMRQAQGILREAERAAFPFAGKPQTTGILPTSFRQTILKELQNLGEAEGFLSKLSDSELVNLAKQKGIRTEIPTGELPPVTRAGEPVTEPLRTTKEGFTFVEEAPTPQARRILPRLRDVDAFVRPLTQKIFAGVRNLTNYLPETLQRLLRRPFSQVPEVAEMWGEMLNELQAGKAFAEQLKSSILRQKPSVEERIALDRVLRGEAKNFQDLPKEVQDVWSQRIVEEYHNWAQQKTTELQGLGGFVREEWISGPSRWYPNFWKRHRGRMVLGRLFSGPRKTAKLSASEKAHQFRRFSDRWTVYDSKGKIAVDPNTKSPAIFKTQTEANGFVRNNSGFIVDYFEGKRVVRESFKTNKERNQRISELRDEGKTIRRAPDQRKFTVAEPMSLEQMVAHGLLEDPVFNTSRGIRETTGLVARLKFYDQLGRLPDEMLKTEETPGYLSFKDVGINIPESIAKRNPNIERLRNGFVREDIANDLAGLYSTSKTTPGLIYQSVESFLRSTVTRWSPFRHIRQPLENELTTFFFDSKLFLDKATQARNFRDYIQHIKGEKEAPLFKEFIKNTPVDVPMQAAPLMDILRSDTFDFLTPNRPLSLSERVGLWIEKNPQAAGVKRAAELMSNAYFHEDIIYKYNAFRYSVEKLGMSPRAAGKRVNEGFFSFADQPLVIRKINKFVPFIPHITYNFSKILLSRLRDFPASTTLKLGAMVYAYQHTRSLLQEMAGLDEKTIDELGDRAPRWHQMVLPITDENGRNIMVDFRWLIPFSEVTGTIPTRVEELTRGVFALLPMSLKGVVTTMTNRNFWGGEITKPTDPNSEKKRKLATNLIMSFMPGMFGQYWHGIYRNAVEKGEETKKPWWEQAFVKGILGSTRRFEPEEEVLRGDIGRKVQLRQVQTELARIRRRFGAGKISEAEFERQIDNLFKRQDEILEEVETTEPEQISPKTKRFQIID